jgi:flagellar biosynthetic protein FliR
MPLSEASLAAWLFAFARLAGCAVFDPLTGQLPQAQRLLLAAALAWTGHTVTGGLLTLTPEQAAPADAAWRALATWLAALAFLAANGHLLVVDALRNSFVALPVATLPAVADLRALGEAAGGLFASGLQLALPALALAVLIQLAFAIVARTTPGLDMLSAGLGVAMLGLAAAWIGLAPLLARSVTQGIERLAVWLGWLG